MKYLVIDQTGTVVNVVIWNGNHYDPGENMTLMALEDATPGVWIGWQFADGQWTNLNPAPIE